MGYDIKKKMQFLWDKINANMLFQVLEKKAESNKQNE